MTVDERESEIGALLEAARQLEAHSGSQSAELRRRALALAAERGANAQQRIIARAA